MSKKRIMILCLTLIMCFPLTAFAAANVGVSKIPPIINDTGIIKPDSTSTPSKKSVYDIGDNYTVSGSASRSDLYTDKCFKGVTSISYSITNNSSKDLKVNLCSYTKWGNVNYGVKKVTIPANGKTSSSFSELSSSKYYFIEFAAPSDFKGTVCGNQ
ncbi:hypothetical protein [Lacrimispora sp. 38-1]|uniref:hypothetical protein n=1 Tax=Lacrimispora sp. 38-1 TaxID=3125778 RepID=UPI003CEDA7E6